MRGFAPLGRLIVLALVGAGLGTVTLATAESAHAATTDGPTAIGVTRDGTSWVGFADGSKLVRVAANGKRRQPVPLGESEAVDGIYVTGDDSVLVDLETQVVVLNSRGKRIGGFDHQPATTCTSRYPASAYGGITFGAGKVWIADRCRSTMSVYRRNGSLQATVKLPGRGRGIAYGAAQSGRPAMVYVALPDAHRVLGFRASSIRSSSRPAQRAALRRPAGGRLPTPSGLAVDAHGQMTVSDTANNAVYLLDTNHGFSLYRTLGHPPRASRQQGRLDHPSALAQFAKNGSGLSGNIFIADTGNGRVQRWDSGGYTHWATRTTASGGGAGGGGGCSGDDWGCGGGGTGGGGGGTGGGGGGGTGGGGSTGSVPVNLTAPTVTGGSAVGSVATCATGTWSSPLGGGTLSYAFQWLRNGTEISGAATATYTVTSADAGTALACRVTASNQAGRVTLTTTAVTVGGGSSSGAIPTISGAPVITGALTLGSTLTCDKGTWTGATPITYAYQWRRAGAPIAGATAPTYVVTAADVGAVLTCAVTASNTAGQATAVSSPATGGPGGGPTNAVPPSITGATGVGSTLTCVSGAWTGTPTFSYQWRRGGAEIAGATAAQYVVTAADPGTALTCTVTARTTGGSTTATSDPVAIPQPPTVSGNAAPGEVLTCTPPAGLGSNASYQWLRNGTPIALATWPRYTVLSADLAGAATLACTVTSGSSVATSAATSVAGWSGHAPGSNGAAPAVTGTPSAGQTLTCDPGAWSGLPPVTTTTTWQRDGQDVATGPTYTVGAGEVGSRLVCVVIVANGYGKAAAATAPVTVQPSAPAVVTAPSIAGEARIGSALTCDKGTWSGTGLTYAYRWSRDGTPIADSGSATYVVLNQDAAASLTCTVTATNTAGSTSRTTAAVPAEPLTGSTPVPTVGPTVSGVAATGQTLTCNRGTWTSATPPSYLTLWLRNGVTVGTGSTYVLGAADSGASVRCLVVASVPGVGSGAARSDAVGGNSCGGTVGVVVNGGAATTTSAQVTLSIKAPAGAQSLQVSNDGDFTGAAVVPLADSCTYAWTVPSIPGLSMDTTVSVRFDNAATVYTDTITVAVPNAVRR